MHNPQFLRYLLALSEHRNFAKAARAMGVSQPALSQGIKRLESDLGVRLFDRSGGSVSPTHFATSVLRHAKQILTGHDELAREVSFLKGLESGTLLVAAGTYAADISGHRAMGRLVERHPGVRCHLELREWNEILELLLSRYADLALAETTIAEYEPSVVAEVINTHPGVFFCRAGHLILRRRRVSLHDISGYPWALVSLPPRLGQGFGPLQPQEGSMDPEKREFVPAIRVKTLAGARQIVLHSDAISASPLGLIEEDVRQGRLVPIAFKAPWLRLNYGFIYLRDRTLSPAARAFMREVRAVEASLNW